MLVQAVWLSYGYRLEFLGEPVYRELWLASVAFFLGNVGILARLLVIWRRSRRRAGVDKAA
jgi:phosphatidylinositol glycan class M